MARLCDGGIVDGAESGSLKNGSELYSTGDALSDDPSLFAEDVGCGHNDVRALPATMTNEPQRRFLAPTLLRWQRNAKVRVFGFHSAYPGAYIEVAPEGQWFIIDRNAVRVREVEPQP